MLHVLKYGRLHGRGVGFQRPDAGFLDFLLSRHFSRNLACDFELGSLSCGLFFSSRRSCSPDSEFLEQRE